MDPLGLASAPMRAELTFIAELLGVGNTAALINERHEAIEAAYRRDVNSAECHAQAANDASAGAVAEIAMGAIAFRGGGKQLMAGLDRTGKVHGKLPKPQDFKKYAREDLAQPLAELRASVQNRIGNNVRLGSDSGHAERQALEQQLIRQLEKYLGER